MNKIILAGDIVNDPMFSHDNCGEAFYKFDLSVDRKSGNKDVLPCIISEIDIANIHAGKQIKIIGEIRTKNYEDCEKRRLNVFVFAKEFEKFEKYENFVQMDSYICKTTNVRTTPLGRIIIDFIAASNRRYGKSDYIPCIAWGRNANRVSLFEIGDHINVKGRLQSRKYNKKISDDEYEVRTAYEVSIFEIGYIDDEDGD